MLLQASHGKWRSPRLAVGIVYSSFRVVRSLILKCHGRARALKCRGTRLRVSALAGRTCQATSVAGPVYFQAKKPPVPTWDERRLPWFHPRYGTARGDAVTHQGEAMPSLIRAGNACPRARFAPANGAGGSRAGRSGGTARPPLNGLSAGDPSLCNTTTRRRRVRID